MLECVEEMLDRMERSVREPAPDVPDGTYYGRVLHGRRRHRARRAGHGSGEATVKGDELILDFSESDGLRKGFVNCTYSSTYRAPSPASFLYFDPALAEFHNEGSMRPVTVIAPAGPWSTPRTPPRSAARR